MKEIPRFLLVVLVFIRKGDSVLLVKQNYGRHYWSLPGGFVEQGETPDQAACREVEEETGLRVKLIRLIGFYSRPDDHVLNIVFEGKRTGGFLHNKATSEISECRYFPISTLPEPFRAHLPELIKKASTSGDTTFGSI